ncbi:hypothetical protein P4S72_18525 [Vibrio sp. PP-XX7]
MAFRSKSQTDSGFGVWGKVMGKCVAAVETHGLANDAQGDCISWLRRVLELVDLA